MIPQTLRRDAPALAIFTALTLVLTNPLVLYLATAVEDKQDALLNTWIIAWVGHALVTDPLNLFHTNIFHPYPNTLAFSEILLPQGIFALPFNLLFDNTVLGHNLVLLSSFLLAAYAAYLFVFDLARSRTAGIIAGAIFAFNPYNLGNLAQVQLLSFGWMPLALLYFQRLLKRMKGSGEEIVKFKIPISDIRIASLFALFFAVQSLSSLYYGFLVGVAVALNLGVFLIVRRATQVTFYVSLLKRLGLSAAIIAIVLAPFVIPYLQVQRDLGFERKVTESEPFSASLKLYTEVSPRNLVYGKILAANPQIFHGGYPLDNLFPGIIATALGIVAVTASRNRERWFYFLVLGAAFVLSLGPRLYLSPTQPTELTLPYRLLYDILPPLRALRAPVRFDALVMFALAVLAGLGLQRVMGNLHGAARHFILPVLGLLLLSAEYLSIPAANITTVPVSAELPPYVRWLARQPRAVVLELPMIASDLAQSLDLTAMYLSTYHWQKTLDGYSGFNPPRRGEIAYEMGFFPSDRSLALLRALDIEYVVFHRERFPDWIRMQNALENESSLRLAHQAEGAWIYRVMPAPLTVPSVHARIYLPQPAAPNQIYRAYLIVENRGKSLAVKPTDALSVDARWSDGTRQRISAAPPLVTSRVSVVPLALRAPARSGDYRLILDITGFRTGKWDVSGEVSVRDIEATQTVLVPLGVLLRAPLHSEYRRGETISVDLTWLPYNKIDAYYSVSVRVVNLAGEKIVAQDREPRGSTFMWTPGSVVEDHFELTLPRDLVPGEYMVQLLMYQVEQGVEVWWLDAALAPQGLVVLGKFSVK